MPVTVHWLLLAVSGAAEDLPRPSVVYPDSDPLPWLHARLPVRCRTLKGRGQTATDDRTWL
jgi:hypothetical protein